MQILKTLENAKAVWGESSMQYIASKQIAESYLQQKPVDTVGTNTHDDIVAQLQALALDS